MRLKTSWCTESRAGSCPETIHRSMYSNQKDSHGFEETDMEPTTCRVGAATMSLRKPCCVFSSKAQRPKAERLGREVGSLRHKLYK